MENSLLGQTVCVMAPLSRARGCQTLSAASHRISQIKESGLKRDQEKGGLWPLRIQASARVVGRNFEFPKPGPVGISHRGLPTRLEPAMGHRHFMIHFPDRAVTQSREAAAHFGALQASALNCTIQRDNVAAVEALKTELRNDAPDLLARDESQTDTGNHDW
jgi:hypothetical protein